MESQRPLTPPCCRVFQIGFGLVCVAVLVIGCASSGSIPSNAVKVSSAQFRELGWLLGEREGSGGENPFYETYTRADDTTITIEYYGRDSTFTQLRGKGKVFLSGGFAYHEDLEGGVWIADAIDSGSIHFVPVRDATTTFLWERESDAVWKATLWWKNEEGQEVERVYTMTRVSSSD